MAFGTVRPVRLFQCTREVSPLSEWVKWRLLTDRKKNHHSQKRMPKVSKMTIVHEVMRQVPNENTKKGVSAIHECGLCGTVDASCEHVSCFMFYVFAFTCHIHILKVTERSLHAPPQTRAFNLLLGAKRSSLSAVWAFFIGFLLFLCVSL